MMAVKFHHKLFILNQYLRKDFQFAKYRADSQASIVNKAISTLGSSLNDENKARQMHRLMNKVNNSYLNSTKEYCLPVAIFVSKHKILTKSDYLKLKDAIPSLNFALKKRGNEDAKE